jgi:uncharacterized lipoprotein YddW (UPF0748 family)
MRRRGFLALPSAAAASGSKREERRAVWWILPEDLSKAPAAAGRKLVRDEVARFRSANFNLILPWASTDFLVALESDLYRDAHPAAQWDLLGVLIDEADSHGIPVHLWYSFTVYRNRASADFNPRAGGDPRWAAVRLDEYRPSPKTGVPAPRRWNDCCPQHHAARRWQRALLLRIFTRYPKLAGLHLEEPGYRYPDCCLCDLCREVFEKLHGVPLADHLLTPEAENFKCLGASAFVTELRTVLRARFPKLALSANGGSDYRRDRGQGRDWGRWARAGWLDYYAAQVYVTDAARFRERLGVTIRDIGADCPVYAGLGFTFGDGVQNSVAEVLRQIDVARELGAAGFALFHGSAFTGELLDALRTGPFRTRGE